jgi:hypothetical protein
VLAQRLAGLESRIDGMERSLGELTINLQLLVQRPPLENQQQVWS